MKAQKSGPLYESALVFEPEPWHNHASCIIQLPNDDLLLCWFHGSGEREADDVIIEGARLQSGSTDWGQRFLMADTLDYPDCNPCIFLDGQKRLWLIYVTILANEWHTALLKYRISNDYLQNTTPKWQESEVLHITPGDKFVTAVNETTDEDEAIHSVLPPSCRMSAGYLKTRRAYAADKLCRRLGWMTRAHPTLLSDGRIILPLYSDGFDFSLMTYTDDDGLNWQLSDPLISHGGIQPSIVERKDGSLAAFMRNNGPAPKRVIYAESQDRGETWSKPERIEIANPGSGLEVIKLSSGNWLMVCNDIEQGRHRLAALISEDEGQNWQHKRYLENGSPLPEDSSYSYPSVIQARDGSIHVSYSYHIAENRKTIKWARFNEDWILDN